MNVEGVSAVRQEETTAAPPPEVTRSQISEGLWFKFYLTSAQFTFSIPKAGADWTGYPAGTEPLHEKYAVFSASQADAFRAAVAAWDRLILPSFTETDDQTVRGVIRPGFTSMSDSTWGYAIIPPSVWSEMPPAGLDIWINAKFGDTAFTPYSYDLSALLHEIGHAIGLKHPFVIPIIPAAYDTSRYTVMSYTRQTDYFQLSFSLDTAGALQSERKGINPGTPMVLDIAALQDRYGAEPTTAAGDDVYRFDATHEAAGFLFTIYDGGGNDTIDLSALKRGSVVNLAPGAYSSIGQYSVADQTADAIIRLPGQETAIRAVFDRGEVYTWTDNFGIALASVIENAVGGLGADTLVGNTAANILTGGGGNDTLDGGAGADMARFSSFVADYAWRYNLDTSWTVRDLRAGSPDGVDTLIRIETIRFLDRAVTLVPVPAAIMTAYANVLRLSAPDGAALTLQNDLAGRMAAGTLTLAQANAQIVAQADASTSVATLAYQFFTGRIPSAGGMDFLVSPTGPNSNNLNGAYYQSFNLENRYINFAVNLGKVGEGKDAFQAAYGARSLFDATKAAYATIFGGTPTDAKVTALLSGGRDAYFAAYGGDGLTGIGTKAAMVGWLMAEAVKADTGMYSRANDAFLTDLADGATFAVDLVGVYGRPEFSVSG